MSVRMVESGRIGWWMSINQRDARARQRSDIIKETGIAGKRSYPPDYSAVHGDNSNKPSSSDSTVKSSESAVRNIQRSSKQRATPLFLLECFLAVFFAGLRKFPDGKPVFPPKEVGGACESDCRWRHPDKRSLVPDINVQTWRDLEKFVSYFNLETSSDWPVIMESEAFDDLEKSTDALRTVKDLAAGAAGGMAQVLLGECAALRGKTSASDEAQVALDVASPLIFGFKIHFMYSSANAFNYRTTLWFVALGTQLTSPQ